MLSAGGEVEHLRYVNVTKHYVTGFDSCDESIGKLWDRHYGVSLEQSTFEHDETINCIAVDPRNEQIAVTVSDDGNIKVWRSRECLSKLDIG